LLLTAKTPVTIYGDREQLQTVLDNLINNAERYSPPDSPIHLELSQNSRWAFIAVRDEGKGLEAKERKKIFRLFYRGSAARNASGHGSGLGLFVVKGIVEQHRGKVTAFSEGRGRGSTFKVMLPIAKQRLARKL